MNTNGNPMIGPFPRISFIPAPNATIPSSQKMTAETLHAARDAMKCVSSKRKNSSDEMPY
jgi:hypothetical protein